jgi:hypothetical protein
LSALDTVIRETPANCATSFKDVIFSRIIGEFIAYHKIFCDFS